MWKSTFPAPCVAQHWMSSLLGFRINTIQLFQHPKLRRRRRKETKNHFVKWKTLTNKIFPHWLFWPAFIYCFFCPAENAKTENISVKRMPSNGSSLLFWNKWLNEKLRLMGSKLWHPNKWNPFVYNICANYEKKNGISQNTKATTTITMAKKNKPQLYLELAFQSNKYTV